MRNGIRTAAMGCGIFMGALAAISGVRKTTVSKLISEGNEHYRSGKLAEAVKAYNQALEIDPGNPEAWNNKGLILAVAGNYKESLKCHTKAVELDPYNVDAISNVGMVHTKLNNHKEALEWYDRALEMDPSHETTWNNKGNLLSKLEKYDESIQCYDRALQINPNYLAAMNNKAVELIHLKRYSEALELLNTVLKSRPVFSEGWYVKGKAYVGMGEFDKAIICLERSHRLNPDFHQAKKALDVLKKKLVQPPGSKAKGIEKKKVATESERDKTEKAIQKEILRPRSSSERIADEFRRPEEHLTGDERVVLGFLADSPRPLSELKNAPGNRLSKQALERALGGLARKGLAASHDAGKERAYSRTQSLGTIQQEMIEEKDYSPEDDTGNDMHALVSKARKYIGGGRHSEAAAILRKALKINPYDRMAVCLLAQSQFEMGQRDRAINTVSKILVEDPGFLPAWFTMANASLKAGEFTDAADCYRKILEIQPSNAEAKKGLEASEAAMN